MRARLAALLLAVATPVAGQDAATLADIRQGLAGLQAELQKLQRELSSSGAAGAQIGGATTLERIDSIEAALTAETRRIEELEGRIQRIVQDGTNRIGDLEFRVCELEPDCNMGAIGSTLPLGGATTGGAAAAVPTTPQTGQAELAVGEKADFDRARAVYDAGTWAEAAESLRAFTENYPGGPLSAEAHFLRGDALQRQGEDPDAARAYLDSFSASQDGPRAPQALLQLGLALGRLNQKQEACVTLSEVSVRFPADPAAGQAQSAAAGLGCG